MKEKYIDYIKEKLKDSFDVNIREITVKKGTIYGVFIDTLSDKKFISEHIFQSLMEDNEYTDINAVKEQILHANILGDVKSKEEAVMQILAGNVVLIFDFWNSAIYCEARNYPKRNVPESVKENVIKGSLEAFNESFIDNVGLIRKRVKNENLKFETLILGKKSNTTVAIVYIKGVAPEKLVNYVKNKVQNMNNDFVMNSNYIEEALEQQHTIFDTIGYTERPDKVSSRLLEGRVAIIVEGSPTVLTAPFFFIENLMASDDYYLNKYYAYAARIERWLAFFLSMFLPGLYIALTTHHFQLVPTEFIFRLGISRAGVPIPTVVEVLLMTFFFRLLREAGIRLPAPTGQTMSIVGALILGEAAVGAGLASQATIVMVSIVAISTFLIPNLYRAIGIWNNLILILAAMCGLPGFYTGVFILLAHMASLRSCGYPHLYPIGSMETLGYKDVIFRGDLNKISNILFDGDDNK